MLVEQINADFEGYPALCDKNMKFDIDVPQGVPFQKKVLATTKIQDGGFFTRWPPDQAVSYENHSKNMIEGQKVRYMFLRCYVVNQKAGQI